jgi:hypothetical protein
LLEKKRTNKENNIMKTIQEIRISFRKKYTDYINDINELNKLIHKVATETDEILSFMETTMQVGEELKVPKQE